MVCMWDKAKGVGRMSGDTGALPECEVKTPMTPYHTAIQVRSSGQCRVGIGRSSCNSLNSGRHEKSLVHCPCSWLAALHGAPRMCMFILLVVEVGCDVRCLLRSWCSYVHGFL